MLQLCFLTSLLTASFGLLSLLTVPALTIALTLRALSPQTTSRTFARAELREPELRAAPESEQPAAAPPPLHEERPATDAPPAAVDPDATCELPLRVTAIMLDRKRPDRSVVAVREARPGNGGIAFVGTTLAGFKLAEVRQRSARFERDGSSCWLRMFGSSARDKIEVEHANERSPAKHRRRRQPPRKLDDYPPTRALSPVELTLGIRKVGTDRYAIDRSTLAKALARWDHVAATTRVARPRGKRRRGLRIVSLRESGVLEALGLRDGDVLRELNGRAVSYKRGLRAVVADLIDADSDQLSVERGGHIRSVEYLAR